VTCAGVVYFAATLSARRTLGSVLASSTNRRHRHRRPAPLSSQRAFAHRARRRRPATVVPAHNCRHRSRFARRHASCEKGEPHPRPVHSTFVRLAKLSSSYTAVFHLKPANALQRGSLPVESCQELIADVGIGLE
jgi:hypothetical protein